MPTTNQCLSHSDILITKPPNFPIGVVREFINSIYGIHGDLSPLDSERDQNFLMVTPNGGQYVLKIFNPAADSNVLDMQVNALEHILTVDPELSVPRVLKSRNGKAIEQVQAKNGMTYRIHVVTYISGINPSKNCSNHGLFQSLGKCLARLVLALRGFSHPASSYDLLWDLKQASNLRSYLHHIRDAEYRHLATYFLDRFDQNVLPMLPKLRAQIVHNDFSYNNLVVDENNPGRIIGIIDFGDLIHSYLVTDLATAVAQILIGEDNPVEVAGEFLAAYNETIPLEPAEVNLLYDLIATRLTMLNVIASWRVNIHPENRDYIMGGVNNVWKSLKVWRSLIPQEVSREFFRKCGLWEFEDWDKYVETTETRESHLNRRSRLLGPCTYLFYKRPLYVVKGEGVWLYDDEDNRYLDVYNNVPHVGHCHPHVVRAIHEQSRKLNISTRYMHGLILELAERITSRMPEPLSICMFVCTGSEANELAWRMSQLVSGHEGALITDYSYHGNGAATIQFSSEEIPESNLPDHVQAFSAPISNTSFHQPDSGINQAIQRLKHRGYHPAMLILDTGFTSNGIFTPPTGYLNTLYAETRARGGLCVADEVQAGFGRFGQHFWGFEFNSVVPDIVTMGKPMGNGHPVAAVVTRPEIAEALATSTGYFNTFGGNPVSCAAGLAVLNVIEKEGLQQNAQDVGKFLWNRFKIMSDEYPILGKIHGNGLLLGIDIVNPDGLPDGVMADRIMNEMREKGVLIGTTGPHGNVLKVRPPIIFDYDNAEYLLDVFVGVIDRLVN